MSIHNATVQMPRQAIPESEKDQEWREDVVDAIIELSDFSVTPGGRYQLIRKAYEYYNGIIDEADYTHVLKPYGKKRQEFPAKLHNYPIIKPVVDLLIGEQAKRPFNFSVVVKNDDVKTRKSEALKKEVEAILQDKFFQELEAAGIPTGQNTDKELPESLEDVADSFERSYRDNRTIMGQKSVNYMKSHLELQRKYRRMWKDFLISGKVVSKKDVMSDEIVYERLNPLHVDYDKSPDVEFIEDGDWALNRKLCLSKLEHTIEER